MKNLNTSSVLLMLMLSLSTSILYSQILNTSHLPIVVVNTGNADIPDEPKISATMGIIDNGIGAMNHIDDPYNHYNGNIAIEVRGNSTQDFEKKTYGFETRSTTNQDSSVALLGMGKEEDWILHAMVIDKTQLRIPMSFYLAQRMGHYAANWRYVELILNGDYRGLYILTERIKRDNDRVDIAKLEPEDIAGDQLTGGYILRIDWIEEEEGEISGFTSNYDAQGNEPMIYQWYYPKAENIQPQQAAYISNFIDDFESAVFSPTFVNEEGKRYTEYIDVNAFADFLLINELSKNSDGYKLSSYLHKDRDSRGGRLVAGPIWDFDQTYGMSMVCSCNDFVGWTFRQNQPNCEDLETMPMWWQAMVSDTIFADYLSVRWSLLRLGPLQEDSIMQWLDTQVNWLGAAIDRNFTRWDEMIGEFIWAEPEPIPESYEAEIAYMKNWISNRLKWMDAHMPSIAKTGDMPTLENAIAYPNPATTYFYHNAQVGNVITLRNSIGQTIYSSTVLDENAPIQIGGFSPGVYILSITGYNKDYHPTKIIIY